MTDINEFYQKGCDKIDAKYVNASFEFGLDPLDMSTLKLNNSWGDISIDLEPAIKDGETQTELKLYPTDSPQYLAYYGEDGIPQCISGDDLSGIISMTKLKDVNSDTVTDGDVYMYNGNTTSFEPYDLKSFANNTNTRLNNIEGGQGTTSATVAALQSQIAGMTTTITSLMNRISSLEALLTKPTGVPANAKVAWSNINIYSDNTNANLRTSGVYSHNPSDNVTNDNRFA